nr:macrophage receptor MARCO-like [Pelodiscus sinensis]|eukprot:XP_025038160.1 macrophage receptor MARCO-like [Pelodiscus sinensis]
MALGEEQRKTNMAHAVQGDTGLKGIAGIPGWPGFAVPPGVTGHIRLAGTPGLKGNVGVPGIKGQEGNKGEKGVKGPKGSVSKNTFYPLAVMSLSQDDTYTVLIKAVCYFSFS